MSDATISGETWGRYSYSTRRGRVEISWGTLPSEAILYFTAPRDRSLLRRTTEKGDLIYMGGLPAFAESLETLVPAVREAVAEMDRKPSHPSAIVFPTLDTGQAAQVDGPELRAATGSLLGLLESERDALGVLYGYVLPTMGPCFSEPNWGGEMSGIRLPDDPHYYSLRADLGRLEMIQYDPATCQELDRSDIRSWDVIPNELGEIRVCRQTMDLGPFVAQLRALFGLLADAGDEVVTIRWESSEVATPMADGVA